MGTIAVDQDRKKSCNWNKEGHVALQASLFSNQGAELVAKRNTAEKAGAKFKGGNSAACAKILGSKLNADNVKDVVLGRRGYPRPRQRTLLTWCASPRCSSRCRGAPSNTFTTSFTWASRRWLTR